MFARSNRTRAAASGPRRLHGLLAGAVAGLAASFVMNQFQRLAAATGKAPKSKVEPATDKAANRLHKAATSKPLAQAKRKPAGNAVHYAFGAALGSVYGVAAEYEPRIGKDFGTSFGLGVAAIFDEAAVPALGLARPPEKTPAAMHVYGIVSHLIFGWTVELTRRLLR